METQAEQEAPVSLVNHVNNNLHSICSNVEMQIKSQQIHQSSGLYAHNSYNFNNFTGTISEHNGLLHSEGYVYQEFPNEILESPFFRRRMKMLSRTDSFMYGKLGADFFFVFELLYPNLKVMLRLIRARPNFYMFSDNRNVDLGVVDCSLYIRRVALRHDCQSERMDMLAFGPMEFNDV